MKRGRLSLSAQKRANAASMAFLAAAAPKPLSDDARALAEAPGVDIDRIHAKRTKPNGRPEGEAQDAGIAYLRSRPDISLIVRFNSGTMAEEGRFIRMNTVYERVWCEELEKHIYPRVVDTQCIKKPGKLCVIEFKAPGWRGVRTEREYCQRAYIQIVKDSGGIGGFATNVEQVREILES